MKWSTELKLNWIEVWSEGDQDGIQSSKLQITTVFGYQLTATKASFPLI